MSDTPETDSPPRLVRLFCHGRCVKRGTCKGEVRRVTVKSGDGRRTWGEYNYCKAAILEDERNGYIVLPNNVIPKTMSDTPETDSLLRKCHNSYGDERAELIYLCRKMEQERNEARDTKWAREIHSCHSACARPICTLRRERDQATDRLTHAEILLTDLACGYWRSVLNEQDPSGEGLMGERVAQYWARYCEQLSTTKS